MPTFEQMAFSIQCSLMLVLNWLIALRDALLQCDQHKCLPQESWLSSDVVVCLVHVKTSNITNHQGNAIKKPQRDTAPHLPEWPPFKIPVLARMRRRDWNFTVPTTEKERIIM